MRSAKQFVSFSLIGLINTAVHFTVFLLLLRALGLPILLSSACGYCAGVANSYFMNRAWTFGLVTRPSVKEFVKFAVVNVVALLVNLLTLQYLTTVLSLSPELSQVGAIAGSLATNFAGNKWWAFQAHE